MSKLKLTAKQEKFVQEVIKGKSQREAYRIAYPRSMDWLDSTVDSKASNLLKKDKVMARYNTLKSKVEKECIFEAKDVVDEWIRIAKANITDFIEFKTENVLCGHTEEGEPIYNHRQVVLMKPSDQVDGRMIQEVSISAKGTLTFKLHSKDTALDKLGRYFGLYNDKMEVNANITNPFSKLTTEELKKLAGL